MADLLPISLSVLLSLSVLGAPGLYVIEGFLHGFTLSGTLASIILFSIQINLIILLCVTKNVKILILFLTIVTVIILIIFIFEIFSSRNFIDNSRQRFYELIEKYPDGTIPDDWNLIMSYRIIKDRRCCGIDLNKNLSRREGRYFYVNFPSNCLRIFTYMSINPYEIYRFQPCMNYMHDLHYVATTMIFISFMLILFWIYVLLRPRKQNRIIQPLIGIPNNQRRIYPSSTSLNYPSNTFIIPPAYQDILPNENKINN